jgi:hypothetical protein
LIPMICSDVTHLSKINKSIDVSPLRDPKERIHYLMTSVESLSTNSI